MAEPPEELVENPKKGVEKGPKATKVAIKNRKTLDTIRYGGVPEWLKGADCKSVGLRLRWFESIPLHQQLVERKRRKDCSAVEAELQLYARAGVAQW